MSRVRGVRGIVAGMFVVGAATVGFAASAVSAGAGVDGIRCEGPQDGVAAVQPAQLCSQLEVTKVVTGTPAPGPAPGTTFDVVVNCVPVRDRMLPPPTDGAAAQKLPQGQTPPFTTTLTFPEGGGTQSVFITRSADCSVTEAPPAGCTLTSIDPIVTQARQPILYPVTVTNNCDPPAQPTVQPAAAVVGTPLFTG
jgi:hypothetical protein